MSDNQKKTWEEITKLYDQQRVELVDYDWPEGDPHPRSGVVRCHSADKKDFYRQCSQAPIPNDSAIVFVGPPRNPEGLIFSPSLIRFEPCGK